MKKSILMGLLSISVGFLQAQVGKYEKITDEKTETFDLYANNVFEYKCKTPWAQSTTLGKWMTDAAGQIILNSNIKLSNFTVTETYQADLGKNLRIVIGGQKKGQAPKSIRKVRAAMPDTVFCAADNDGIIAEMDKRQKLQIAGSPQQLDSLRQTEARRYYTTALKGEVRYIQIETDKYTIEYTPKDPKANCFVFTTNWSEDAMYLYYENEPFVIDKKQLKCLRTQEYYKPAKK